MTSKKVLFIGRLENDLGLETYFKAIDYLKFKVDFAGDGSLRKKCQKYGKVLGFMDIKKIIKSYDVIFTSSYLSIMESLINKKPVIAVYENSLKEDYLKMSPFSKYIQIINNSKDINLNIKYSEQGYKWAKEQTWGKVTDIYLKLWQKYL
jgi:glycosyltransferase involved in cell wall biosynthesis